MINRMINFLQIVFCILFQLLVASPLTEASLRTKVEQRIEIRVEKIGLGLVLQNSHKVWHLAGCWSISESSSLVCFL